MTRSKALRHPFMKTTPPSKRLVIVHGDKGGVGKSTFARLLADYYTSHSLDWCGYDTDATNGHLLRFYPGHTTPIDIHEPGSLDQLLNSLEQDGRHWLVDLGAQGGDKLVAWMAETEFLAVCHELGVGITIAFVLSPVKDSAVLLKSVTDQLGDEVSYLVVKNEATGASFAIYDASKTKVRLMENLGATEILFPELLEHVYYKIDKHNLAWSESLQGNTLELAERQRVKAFLRAGFAEVEKAKTLLVS